MTPSPIRWRFYLLLTLAVLLPVAFAVGLPHVPPDGAAPVVESPAVTHHPASSLPLTQSTLGPAPSYHPLVTNVQIVDLDRDGLPDVLACDARRHRVLWYRQAPRGRWEERALGGELLAPGHATPVDLDGDGRLDVLVAVLGSVFPTDERVGRVAWLHELGGAWKTDMLLDDLRRVADVQAGDLDGDGDTDLIVAEFGYARGRVLWLENRGGGRFRDHVLLAAPGAIHVPVADFDGDGDVDAAALVSQDDEDVWAFENVGGSRPPRPRLIHSTLNFDLGSTGLVQADLDRDGQPDLLVAAGDNLEVRYPWGQPWHGCIWLRNLGGWKFEPKRIAHFAGAYAVAAGDLDGDGDTDVVLASLFNDWRRPGSASLVWLENDGSQQFRPWQIADRPTHLATVACGDLDGDGRADVVAGGLHLLEPFDRLGRITLWLSNPGGRP